jgi:hypothetical protein
MDLLRAEQYLIKKQKQLPRKSTGKKKSDAFWSKLKYSFYALALFFVDTIGVLFLETRDSFLLLGKKKSASYLHHKQMVGRVRFFTKTAAVCILLSTLLVSRLFNFFINQLAGFLGGKEVSLFYVPIEFIAIILAFSTVVGALIGLYPSRRAAKLNPLDALRYK